MKQNELFPKIRFKEFTNAWEQWKAKNLFIPFREKNILNNNLISYSVSNRDGFINQREYFDDGGKAVYASKKNSLIIDFNTFAYNPSRINVGSLCLYKNKEKGLVSPIYEVFKLRNDQNPDFFYLWFKTRIFKKIIANNSNKSVRDTLNLKQFEDQLIITPILSEQNTISSLFSVLDSLITLHQRKYLALKNLKNTLLEKMFCDEKSKFPHIRFKEFTNAWEQWKVKDIFEITRGYVVSKKEILETKSGEYIYPIYSSQTINDGLLGYYKSYLASNAITWTTDGANAGTVSYRKGRFYATNVCGLLSTKAFTPNLYLAFALSSETYKHVAKVGNPKLMNNTMANIELIITSNLVEQSKISSLFSNLDSLITLHQRKLELLKNTKNTLLDKMFV
ncbi:restriction endonuclease subunit S [Mycoplasma feriruminatoris]|uniref:restriction endonuclease subunit S n=1 Tax=Mycoplasma feriruminatoris TaxID=1179777 RepID=UPI00241FB7EF|nr:restriction endonuclease subunit S [Mycoplasma feriruminatoris]WFQ96327.1 restriction endonuclease subunit S [Mycoplasma feriruminatoris]